MESRACRWVVFVAECLALWCVAFGFHMAWPLGIAAVVAGFVMALLDPRRELSGSGFRRMWWFGLQLAADGAAAASGIGHLLPMALSVTWGAMLGVRLQYWLHPEFGDPGDLDRPVELGGLCVIHIDERPTEDRGDA